QAEDGIRDFHVTGVQTCALPILLQRFESYRIGMQSGIEFGGLTKPEESALLVAVSRPLGKFLEQLFHTDSAAIVARTQRDSEVRSEERRVGEESRSGGP